MMLDTDLARQNMIRQQIRTWDVHDPVILNTLASIPRELFVADKFANLAFADTTLPLEQDNSSARRHMLNPKIEGRMLQTLQIKPTEQVLIIGTGSGYLTACCAQLARHVTSVDTSAELTAAAESRLSALGLENVDYQIQADLDRPGNNEFDVIAVTGSLPVYDARIETWLRPGGRAFVFVGSGETMEACLIECSNERQITYHSLFETSVPPLANAAAPGRFDLLA